MQQTLRILLFLTFLSGSNIMFAQYRIQDIPDPKVNGQDYFVSSPDNYISQSTVSELNLISTQIEAESSAEYAIVIVNNYDGYDDHEFALELFNTWGIGKPGVDNGLLLFIAISRREYRFISGRGMEGVLPDIYLKRIGEKYIVPSFRQKNYDEGLLETSEFIAHILTSPDSVAELERLMPEVGSFWRWNNPYFKKPLLALILGALIFLLLHYKAQSLISTVTTEKKPEVWSPILLGFIFLVFASFILYVIQIMIDESNVTVYKKKGLPLNTYILVSLILSIKVLLDDASIKREITDLQELQNSLKSYLSTAAIPSLVLPLAWYAISSYLKLSEKNKGRFDPPDDSGNWKRHSRSAAYATRLLSLGQKVEEKIKSLKYEVWENTTTGEVVTTPWDLNKTHHKCPQCLFRTLVKDRRKEILKPTYSTEGEMEVGDKCLNCDYYLVKKHIPIPMKVRQNSSGSSSSSSRSYSSRSSSRGSSSSGRGSWGGGSSGGGGAGGKW